MRHLHGLDGSGRHLGEAFDALARQARLVVPDLLGFGVSWKRGTRCTLGEYLDARDAVTSELLLDRAPSLLVGHSTGSVLALGLARRHPAHPLRVACFGPAVYADHRRAALRVHAPNRRRGRGRRTRTGPRRPAAGCATTVDTSGRSPPSCVPTCRCRSHATACCAPGPRAPVRCAASRSRSAPRPSCRSRYVPTASSARAAACRAATTFGSERACTTVSPSRSGLVLAGRR